MKMEKQFADINCNSLISANQGGTYLHLVSIVPYIDMLRKVNVLSQGKNDEMFKIKSKAISGVLYHH